LRHIALFVADEPEFAVAVTNALLGKEPDVDVLRQRIGRDIRDRLAAALGPDTDPDVIDSLEMLYSGALVRAGMGYASYADIAARLEKSARLILVSRACRALPVAAVMAGSTMPPKSRRPRRNSAVSSRNPPSRISANGARPAAGWRAETPGCR